MQMTRTTNGARSTKVCVLVVQNLPLVRFGLAKLIEASPRFRVCGRTGDVPTARALFVREQPDLVVLGLTLSGGDGIELIKDFRKLNPLGRVLVFSTRGDQLSTQRAFRAGAHGYVVASEGTAEVLHAVSELVTGHLYASRTVLREIAERGATELHDPHVANLSDRELQVLSLIGRGFGASRLAHELHLSVKTIETHQMHLKEKLGLQTAAELSRKASEWMIGSAQRSLDFATHAIRRERASLL